MRPLVFGLLLANLFYLAWHHWVRLPDIPAQRAASARLPSLSVASERAVSDNVAPGRPAPGRAEPVEPPPPRSCRSLGPFPDPAAARVLADRLSSDGIETVLRSRDTEVSGGWWVYLGPEGSRQAARALTGRLASAGIDDFYIVPSGDLRNAVSLGLFREQGRAEYQAAEARRLGFEPTVRERMLTESAFWLDFKAQSVPLGPDDLQSADGQLLRVEDRECPPAPQTPASGGSAWSGYR
jgi:hypothetical protein